MKNLLYYTFVLSFLLITGCKQSVSGTDYVTEKHTDAQGYSYEAVSNDPTGLRLYTLDNGLKVYLSQNHDEPKIQTYVAVRAGSSYDPADNTGLAHYLEHMLFKGTSEFGTQDWETEKIYLDSISDLFEKQKNETDPDKKKEIYREIDRVSLEASNYSIASEYDKMVGSLGAQGTNAHTSNEETVYHNKIPANELEKWAKLEKDRFSELVLRLFHTELEAVYEEFNRGLDDDGRKKYYAMNKALFPNHPYGLQTTIGTSEHLKNPSMVAIHNYFNKYYVPNNMAVVLVGDFEFEPTIKLIDDTFGQLENKEVEHPDLPEEEPLESITQIEVFGPTAESVRVAFRVNGGLGTEDHKKALLIDMMLSNSQAGLIDLNLNQSQKVQRAGSYHSFLNEYGMHYLDGMPKAGQSLDEVKDLMLAELDKIKKGEFDDWLIDAVINDLKLSKLREYENSTSLASAYYINFVSQRAWADEIRFLDELKKITKKDLMAYASENYGDNYVLLYKRQGEDPNIAKVEKPQITPVNLNRGKQSAYYRDFSAINSGEIQPLFVDYKAEIQKSNLNNGLEVSYIENKTNDLFSLNIIFDMGSDHDKKLALAVAYLDYVGTDQLSPDEVKKEFYKLGINYGVNTGSERSYVGLSGLQENMDKGLVLLENLWDNAKADQESYDKFVEKILKARIDGKAQKDNILWSGMLTYGIYGENSRLRDIFDTNELQSMDPNELIQMVKDLKGYKQRIFYYGNDLESTISSLNNSHRVPAELKNYPEPKKYEQIATGNQVNFVDFDMVQAEIILVAKADQFDAEKMAYGLVFNDYFGYSMSSILMQELRESKSLAYAVFAEYVNASKKENSDVVWAYIGTQADKLPEAVDGLMVLMKDMPEVEEKFDSSKKSALKKIAAQRITKSNIFWNYERLKRRGIDYDIRKDMYESIKNMTLQDLSTFFDQNVKGGEYTALVIGKKSDLDLNALKKMGDVKEMDIDYLFNYTDMEVKQ